MKLNSSQLRCGDFILGFGTVDSVRFFYNQKADKTKKGMKQERFVPKQDAGKMARLVAEQQEGSYTESVETVLVRFKDGKTKTFQPDETVNVYRFSKAV